MMMCNITIQGLLHPARKGIPGVYWKVYNTLYCSAQVKTTYPKNGVYLSKDNGCFVAHHKEVEHPYELTKALPTRQIQEESQVLKVNSRNMFTKSPNLEQLQSLTYTPAIYWRQWPGREKRQKYKAYFDDNVDRPGLVN